MHNINQIETKMRYFLSDFFKLSLFTGLAVGRLLEALRTRDGLIGSLHLQYTARNTSLNMPVVCRKFQDKQSYCLAPSIYKNIYQETPLTTFHIQILETWLESFTIN